MVGDHCDVKCIKERSRRENRTAHDFVRDRFYAWLRRQQRNPLQRFKTLGCKTRIPVRCLIDDVLGCDEFIIGALVVPPSVRIGGNRAAA